MWFANCWRGMCVVLTIWKSSCFLNVNDVGAVNICNNESLMHVL